MNVNNLYEECMLTLGTDDLIFDGGGRKSEKYGACSELMKKISSTPNL
jgi:hypothetical protein